MANQAFLITRQNAKFMTQGFQDGRVPTHIADIAGYDPDAA
jgi:hypothetical protein